MICYSNTCIRKFDSNTHIYVHRKRKGKSKVK